MDNQKSQKTDARSRTMMVQDVGVIAPQKPVSRTQFARWIRALLQNWRQGTVGVKGRSDVSFSNRKPWKQKGTGRARAGSARSPLWRGGGVTFGPQPRTRVIAVPKIERRRILSQLFAERLDQGNVIILDWQMQGDVPKTKEAVQQLQNAQLYNKKITVFLSPTDLLHYAAFTNIPNVQVLLFDQPNAYDLANSEYWVVLQKDMDAFKEMIGKWQ